MLSLNIFAWITVAVIFFKAAAMLKGNISGDMLALIIISILLLTGTLTDDEALSSFSSMSVVIVGVMLALSTGMVHAGVMHWISRNLGYPKNLNHAMRNLMVSVSAMSAFFGCDMIAVLFINVVKMWSKKINVPASKLLIPLSYAAVLGGLCTIIGCSTNLLAAAFFYDHTEKALSFFAPFIPGAACTIVGTLTVILLQNYLPVRKLPEESFESSDNYTVELMVPTDCPHIGETVKEARLKDVPGGHLIEIVRFDREIISPVPANEYIFGGDHLVFSGRIDDILQLKATHKLVNATHHVFSVKELNKNRTLQMATVSNSSSLIGKCMSQTNFEEEHDVVLIAVTREGERIKEIPRETIIYAGDTLLFEGARMKRDVYGNDLHFFDQIALPQQGPKTYLSFAIMICMVALSALKILPLLHSALLAIGAMVLTRCCTLDNIRRAINWKVIMIFAGSVCIGTAIEKTGIADTVGEGIASTFNNTPLLALIMLCMFATICTEFISNTTATAVLIPIGLEVAEAFNANPLTFTIALMISISSTFATPIGNTTNTMIYGPGGYKFTDFAKIGMPMNIVVLITNIVVTCLVYPM